MKRTVIVLGSFLGLMSLCHPAAASTTQQMKMKTCNAEASQKALNGDARKTFMQTCLSAHGSGNTQQDKMKLCNKDAAAKGLKGADRQTFMKSCLSAN